MEEAMFDAPSTPKRKRIVAPPVMTSFDDKSDLIDTTAGGSPRTLVASRFNSLQLQQQETDNNTLSNEEHEQTTPSIHCNSSRKRLRFDQVDVAGPIAYEQAVSNKLHQTGPTPEPRFATSGTVDGRIPTSLLHSKRKKSPPPTSNTENPSPLVWHDWEITGHLMDSADDDGVGINGIGFKPTAQMKFSQSQKRKQQIAEWKAREAREARQKRSERRRASTGSFGYGEHGKDIGSSKTQRVRFNV